MTDQPITGTTDIDFLRSTTTITVHREADGDTDTTVNHLARFGIKPGSVEDLRVWPGASHSFQPQWLEATWANGRLRDVVVTGPRILKNGDLGVTQRKFWSADRGGSLGTDAVPAGIVDAVAAYEAKVADAREVLR